MTEARKRGPRKAGVPPKEHPPETVQPGAAEGERIGQPTRGGTPTRIALPSSGLAEDILSHLGPEAVAAQEEKPTSLATQPPTEWPAPTPEESRSHNISFFAAPAREDAKPVEATEHLATFLLAGEEYGVDVRLVQEIIRVSEITQVPRAPEFIKGVINLRGRIIPVVDLKRKLNLGEVEATRLARIVVVKIRERLIGLLVDGASQVLKVPVASIEAAPEEVMELHANYIRGVAKLADRLIILMDLLKILAPELPQAALIGEQ